MSNTMILMQMLEKAEGMSAKQMSARSGLAIDKVYGAMQILRKRKAIASLDTPYQLTEEGAEWLRRRIEREMQAAAKKVSPKPVVQIEDDDEDIEADRARIARLAQDTVARARSVPNSVFSLGANHG